MMKDHVDKLETALLLQPVAPDQEGWSRNVRDWTYDYPTLP